jgi:cyclophilin family peptidyl-prolyl cis-trans isomerase/HEAT repeat protein
VKRAAPAAFLLLASIVLLNADGGRALRPVEADGGRVFRPGDQADPRAGFHKLVDPAIDVLWASYDSAAAMGHVRFISQYWRLPGNPGYNLTVDRIRERLTVAGLTVKVEEYLSGGPAWDHSAATLAIVRNGAPDEIVLSREKEHLALCINSFSTPGDGIVAPLVDVGRGDRDEDYAGKTIKGAVVLGDADVGQLWRRAVAGQGALGVISTALPKYLNADPPGAKPTPRDQWDILQWSSVPYDEMRKAFGFKSSPRAAATMRKRLAAAGAGGVTVRVNITSSFATGPVRTLVAEIPGAIAAGERIVMAAHIQEPGANDNASGVATLAELAASMSAAIRQKKIPAPARTLTFLFINEISGSRRWLQDHPEDAKQVKYMFSLDMTGEDVAKTGGSFLIERYPDPGAVWERPWDPHSEWGKGNVRADSLKGDLINDAHFAVVQRVAQKTKWVVKTNPYEGGSDHTVFGQAGVPSLLDWHFTDRYYHTNFDTPDKTSPEEMRNVAVAVGATAWLFGSASESVAIEVAKVVASAGRDRIAVEEREGAKLVAAATDKAAAQKTEATILAAWRKWYGEAVRSASRLVNVAPTISLRDELNRLASPFDPPKTTGALFGLPLSLGLMGSVAPGFAQAPQIARVLESTADTFICGKDAEVQPIPLRWSTVVLAGDARLYVPCLNGTHRMVFGGLGDREIREREVLEAGFISRDPEVRWRAAQALVRIGRGAGAVYQTGVVAPVCNAEAQIFGGILNPARWQPGELFRMLRHTDSRIRREAAYGLGVALSRPGLDANVGTAARKEVAACLINENSIEVTQLLLEAIGVTRYGTDDDRAAATAFLIERTKKLSLPEVLGAVKGLEALLRQAPGWEVGEPARVQLRELVARERPNVGPGDVETAARIRRLAMAALQAARDADVGTLDRAANDQDWQVRRLVAMMLNLADAAQARIGDRLSADPAFQVRYDYLGSLSRQVTRTHLCAPLAHYLEDAEPTVILRAMDLINAQCTDLDEAIAQLKKKADLIEKAESHDNWHQPARALGALARVRPDEAKRLMSAAIEHPVWQVRAQAATSSVTMGMFDEAIKLARDPVANVQTAAIEALARAKNPGVIEPALDVLRYGSDFQVLRAAAGALNSVPEEARNDAGDALLSAMRRLTDLGEDPSRDPRVAILGALGRVIPPNRTNELLAFMADVDDEVNLAAAKAFQAAGGIAAPTYSPKRRYPYQPPELAIRTLPIEATIQLEQGTVVIALLASEAPVTIARFATLVKAGYYNGLTFHRIVPNFVVQGGSPGASEYVGTARFMRDEVGPASHIRGAVGISTRGKDTGDGQIFIDLVDLPRLDRDYTVFGHVISGMEFVDVMLEGARIKAITLKDR